MIKKVQFRNLKALRDVDVDLERLTVLVGPNGSGKTSILQGIYYLSQLGYESPEGVFSTSERLLSHLYSKGSNQALHIALQGNWQGKEGKLAFKATPQIGLIELKEPQWEYSLQGTWDQERFDNQSNSLGGAKNPYPFKKEFTLQPFHNILSATAFLRLEPSHLAEASYSEDVHAMLHVGGAGLASVLAELALRQPEEFQRIQDSLRSVIPSVKRVRLTPASVTKIESELITIGEQSLSRQMKRNYIGHGIVFDTTSGTDIPAYAMSEGTLLTLGILTVLSLENHPRLVLLDDLERGFHPKALESLVKQIRKMMDLYPHLQIVATTHSPYLLDFIKFEEIRLTTLQEDGSVLIGSFHEHPDFAYWKENMFPGEFWSMVAEDWLKNRKVSNIHE